MIDIGGESTRPTSEPVSEEEERRRVLPVIRDLKARRPDAIISVDTYKANVARAAVEVGAEVVNDVSGFRWDPKMAKTLAELKVGAVLMHTRGRPADWPSLPPIGDAVLIVKRDLRQWAEAAMLAGIQTRSLGSGPRFWIWKAFRGKLSSSGSLCRTAADGIPATGRRVAKIIYRADASSRWQRCAGHRAAPRNHRGGNGPDPERRTHSNPRCKVRGRGGESNRRDCCEWRLMEICPAGIRRGRLRRAVPRL